MADDLVTLTMTRQRARELGLIFCACGAPANKHFEHGTRPCAHCDCKALDEVLSRPDVSMQAWPR